MSDSVLHSFMKLRGLLPSNDVKSKEIKSKNKEYVAEKEKQFQTSMINKIIKEKPKEKIIIQYFSERLKELDEVEMMND
jgi:hypothetical protein